MYLSVYTETLIWYPKKKIDYKNICFEFQELCWIDGHRTPLDGKRLKMYIKSMREVVDCYKALNEEGEQ